MNQKSSKVVSSLLPVIYLILAFLYIVFVVQPTLYFHHAQSPFVLSNDFLNHYFKYPGGVAEWVANFFMQLFYFGYFGSIVFLGIACIVGWLTYALMNAIFPSKLNRIWALAPFTLTIVLANNYNFPFSIVVSVVVVLLLLLLLAKTCKTLITYLITFTAGAIFVYYFCGSGYLFLFSVGALLLAANLKLKESLFVIVFILAFTFLLPLVGYHYLFAIPSDHKYFNFFPKKLYFMAYNRSIVLYVYLLSVPVLLAFAVLMAKFQKIIKQGSQQLPLKISLAYSAIIITALFSHQATYRSDAKKIAASDYYCYTNNAEKTAIAATGIRDFNILANLNYNLAMSKAGKLNDAFFSFFQIMGPEALHPDNAFLAERAFIAADFYYQLGYISEARHWAYEALVFYPYSSRALKLLVKIHLVTKEYKVAEHYLNTLNKGLIDRRFVREYTPFIKDTSRTNTNQEIAEKRSFIPAERELNPLIEHRFIELLEANKNNKSAYEHLMLYYLLDSQPEKFMELYKDAGVHFDKPVTIYEEALLMFAEKNETVVIQNYKISPATIDRFNEFSQTLKKYEGNSKLARNALFQEYGTSYMYYLQFVYPRIVKSEISNDDDEVPSI